MLDLIAPLVVPNTTKIVLLSLDGLGGLPRPETGRSELETARLPNLAALAAEAACGRLRHVAPGITPGSGPGHLGLFGYDPLRHQVGRGVLEALGIEFDLRAGDVAARGNFCTVDAAGRITDRRAGRIPTETCVRLTERLRTIRLPGVELFVEPVKEHRFVLVLRQTRRGGALAGRLSETDPQAVGRPPLPVRALAPGARATAERVNRFVAEARRRLRDATPANMVLLRGFDQLPKLPRFPEVFGLGSAAIAAYPMYRGLAKLVGMEVLKTGGTFADEVATLREHWDGYDFFFVHYKDTDKAGEDGDFDAKVDALERLDRFVPAIRDLRPDVLVVTGDHATPSILAAHGWQPVPILLWSRYCGADGVTAFTERTCAAGSLGVLPAHHLMPLVMANALRLTKFGA
ncbi:MAG: phosphoglycerate mutase [Candidatus Rokubacteria bacterium RIFCSPHIGHO2_12_FULL_73_22]|nr:MAG: phosphoglycerate mutase [Candidatus Rokubacteria bacterium RIFCSPHIGHO2_02_FULL_73_26]OGL03389.1 MAG: phosphoglycerate mutase [Candidatus Rokubacteria bacterium RIFCSPHIGHO2_12_FULL_73_22]OGL10085.1 MAG: phosphoglycerate mutase [Candidatus Rokubacteria bacterium RIFCSPLOWO2_02_FULL_73_56]OGL23791.1 MAG: phosphoglycerate mutase [Candidatus Rokubacteria bacterium RIFCSPLOWO2_12_FULL_73_47]